MNQNSCLAHPSAFILHPFTQTGLVTPGTGIGYSPLAFGSGVNVTVRVLPVALTLKAVRQRWGRLGRSACMMDVASSRNHPARLRPMASQRACTRGTQ